MKKPLIILLVCIAGLYGCWQAVAPTATWRYRLTITVNDNGTLKTGSSVIEIVGSSTRDVPLPIPGRTGGMGLRRGEAVAIDLGQKGVLFALLRSEKDVDHAASIVCHIFEFPGGPGGCGGAATPEGIRYYAKLEGKADVPTKELPMFVRFRDINDPKTIERVDPNDLEASFGPGVLLKGVTIEMTDDAVTTGIEKWLNWLPGRKNVIGYLGGWPEDLSKLYLNGSEFSRGVLNGNG